MSNAYGNVVIPGITTGTAYRSKGAIFRGPHEREFYKIVNLAGGTSGDAVPYGAVFKYDETNSRWVALATTDIVANTLTQRLGVVVDESAVYGTDATVQLGLRGVVDQAQLVVGNTAWSDLSEANQKVLELKFAAWGIDLIHVEEA